MNKNDIIYELKDSGLDLSKVWLLCGAAMVMHELRETTSDIDLGSGALYFNELLKMSQPKNVWENGDRSIQFSQRIEIFEEWNISNAVFIEGIATSSVEDIIAQKEALNRVKDKSDLEILYSLRNKKE
jgi:hypothetical protein